MPQYDVFLSHNSQDKAVVEALAHRLRAAGLEPFLDKWHLVPGQPWIKALEEALEQSASVAVFFGPSGVSPWHNAEMQLALRDAVNHSRPLISVLLPGVQRKHVTGFLVNWLWVDFSTGLDNADAFSRLINGIRGQAPGATGADAIDEGTRANATLADEAFDGRLGFLAQKRAEAEDWKKLHERCQDLNCDLFVLHRSCAFHTIPAMLRFAPESEPGETNQTNIVAGVFDTVLTLLDTLWWMQCSDSVHRFIELRFIGDTVVKAQLSEKNRESRWLEKLEQDATHMDNIVANCKTWEDLVMHIDELFRTLNDLIQTSSEMLKYFDDRLRGILGELRDCVDETQSQRSRTTRSNPRGML